MEQLEKYVNLVITALSHHRVLLNVQLVLSHMKKV